MSYTQVELRFSVYDSKQEEVKEDFNLLFNLQDETLGVIFDKFEVMLTAMGFVLDGKKLCLVDQDEQSEWEDKFLSENQLTPFSVIPGDKD